jgi:hypothetical protein
MLTGVIVGNDADPAYPHSAPSALSTLSNVPAPSGSLLHALVQSSAVIGASHDPDDTDDHQPVPRELDFAYYSVRDGFQSQLQLVSDYPKPFSFRIAVHSLSGRTVLHPRIRIRPQQKLSIDMRTLLVQVRVDRDVDFEEGSISITYVLDKSPLLGQVTISNPSYGLVFESLMGENDPGQTALPEALDGLWWGLTADREAKVMVSNTSNQPVTADVALSFGGKRHPIRPLAFDRHETKILSIPELLAVLSVKPEDAPEGGITITGRGSRPMLIAAGMIADWRSGFSTTMHFMLMGMPMSSTLYAAGVPIGAPSGDSPFASAGIFTPHVIVRNMLPSPQVAAITLEIPSDAGTQQFPLALLTIPPFSTEDASLEQAVALLPKSVPYASIRVQYDGDPGSAMVEVSSVEQNQNLVVDSKLGDPNDPMTGSGINPWHLGDHTEAMLFLTDAGDKPARIGFQIQANGVHYYLTHLKLNPHETRVINIRKLRDMQKPDFKGNKIPASATDGSLVWIRLDKVPVVGRLLILDSRRGISSNFDCSCTFHCPTGYQSLTIAPAGVTMAVGNSQSFTVTEGYGDCYGTIHYYNVSLGVIWTTSDSSVCSVDSSAIATAKGPGTATITATYTDDKPRWFVADQTCNDNYISKSAYASVTVTPPTADVSLRTSNEVSTDNAARENYRTAEGTYRIGPIIATGSTPGCFGGFEAVGTITPSNYTGNVILHRQFLSDAAYTNSTKTGGATTPADDTSDPAGRDDDPQSTTTFRKASINEVRS